MSELGDGGRDSEAASASNVCEIRPSAGPSLGHSVPFCNMGVGGQLNKEHTSPHLEYFVTGSLF